MISQRNDCIPYVTLNKHENIQPKDSDLVGSDKVSHGDNLVVILVRFGLLGIKWVDTRLHQNVSQH